jgi:gliding motility-associated-like protein
MAQCGVAIDLNTWVEEGDPAYGDWQVTTGGDSVLQVINGEPTFFVSPDSFINVIIRGSISVNTANDDDWIGFVFGYQDPDTISPNYYDFYLFDWKQNNQNFGGNAALEGYALSRVDGTVTNFPQTFAGKTSAQINVLQSQYSNTDGWIDFQTYNFALTYTNTRTVIEINGDTLFNITGCFPPGRFGFYNYSQSQVSYSDFSYEVAAEFDVVTPEVCVGDSAFIRAYTDSCYTNAGVQVNNTIVGWDWDLGDGSTSTDTNVYHVYNAAGTYPVRLVVTDYLGCTDTAYNSVLVRASSTDLGPDTAFCADTSLVLDAGTPGSTYLWNTGATSQTISTTTAGNYHVTLTDIYSCENMDTTVITLHALPTKNLPNDTSICAGDSLTLDAQNVGASFVWNNGATTQSVLVKTAGQYIVTITNGNGCQISDTFNLGVFTLPVINFGVDTSICNLDTLTLDAGNAGSSFLWQDGSTNQTLNVFSQGQYEVTVTDANTCSFSDTLDLGIYTLPAFDLGADTTICIGDTLLLNAQNSTSSFVWNTGATSQSINALIAANYQVTVTDTNTCSSSDTIVLALFTIPVADLGNDTTICIGDSISINPNNNGQLYSWSTTETTETIVIDSAGSYSITVTDANTCRRSDTMQLSLYALPVVDIQSDTIICIGDSLFLDAANAGASYLWQDASTNQNLTINTTGQYAVTVTDANTCANSDSMTLSLFSLPVVNLGNDTSICSHDTLTLDAANPTASFVWNSGQTTQTIDLNLVGSYQVTVTDTNTCFNADTLVVSFYTLPVADLGNDTTICIGDSISINPNNSGQLYAWSTTETTETIVIDSAGSYSITVTDANTCRSADTMQLSLYALPVVDIQSDTTICIGDSLILDAANAGASFLWQDASTNQNLTINTTGQYAVTVTDANTCANSDSMTLSLFSLPVVNLGNDTSICSHDTLTLDAANPTASFVWNSGQTTQTIDLNLVGNYQVTVTDTNTCSNADTLVVSFYTLPVADLGNDTTICIGDSISINPNNSGQLYAWSTTETTESAVIDSAGSFSVTVTDANTCRQSDTMQLSLYALPVVDINADSTICSGDSLILDAANAGASYLWQDASINQELVVNSPGMYSVTVTDINTCANSDSMLLSLFSLPVVDLGKDTTICASDSLVLNAQNPFAAFNWNVGAITQTLVVSSPGFYHVTVTDSNTCSNTDSFTLAFFALPMVDLGPDTVICDQDTLFLDAQNTTATFVWQDGSTNQTYFTLQAGTYTVTVTDTNTCSNTDSVMLNLFNLPIVNLGPDTNICLGDNYVLNAQNNGASYLWKDGSANQTLIIDSAGTYAVTVTDGNTCSSADSMQLVINQLPVLNISPSDTSICLGESVVLQAMGDANIIWLNGVSFFPNGTTNSLSPADTTIYTIEGTDSIGCVNTYSTNINILPLPTVDIALSQDSICVNDSVSGLASGAVSYTWTPNLKQLNNAGAANTFFPTQTSVFEVTGTDAFGCENAYDTIIHVNALPIVVITPSADSLCVGESTQLIASGAASYVWSPSTSLSFFTDDTVSASPVDTITYLVTGTDSNQCVNDTSVTITVTPLPVLNLSLVSPITCTQAPNTINVTGAITYEWGPSVNITGQFTDAPVVTPVSSTTYSVTATGAGGCQEQASILVPVYSIPTFSAGSDTAICAGDTFNLNASGGVSYLWNNGNSLSDPAIPNPLCYPNTGKFYRVTITDSNGCEFEDNMFVDVNARPRARAGVASLSTCKGDTIQIGGNPTGPIDGTFRWTPTTQVINPQASNPFVFADTNTTFQVVVTNAFGCSDSAVTTIFVDSLPDVELLATPDFICKNDTGLIRVSTGFMNYRISPLSSALPHSNARFEVFPDQTTEYFIAVTDAKGCTRRITVPIEVKSLPMLSAGDDPIVCEGDTATLMAGGVVETFFWGNALSLESPDSIITRAFPIKSTTYTLFGTDSNGCTGSDQVRVRIHAKPVAHAGAGVQDCDLGTVTLGGNPTGPEFSSYTWWPAETLDDPYSPNPRAFIEDSITYYLEVENEFGCLNYDSVTVVPDCYSIYAPNAFTPDGDGINDVFKIKGFRYLNPRIEIFNRNGQIIFTSVDFEEGWNGNDLGSYPAPIGVYHWRMTFEDKRGRGFREEGEVALLR